MSDEKDQEIIIEEDSSSIEPKFKKVKDQLKQCQKEKHDYLTGWQREKADFINYKRRQEEQMSEWSKMLGEGLVKDLLPVLDTLSASEFQIGSGKNNNPTQPPLSLRGGEEGLKMVREQLMKILQKHGLEEMKSIGEKFNPERHEAIEQVESEGESGVVVEEVLRGYLLNGKVLRVAKVKVTK